MTSSSWVYILLFTLPSYIFSQTLLDRLNVPIYLSTTLSTGYDTNIFRLSEFEKQFEFYNYIPIIDGDQFHSSYIAPKISISYSPALISGVKTQLTSSLSRTHYIDIEEKSYNVFFSQLAIKLGAYRWLKFSHRFLPEYYLRNYLDEDVAVNDYFNCSFSSESFSVSFSNPLIKKVWSRLKYTRTNLYYNIDFTEYDTVVKQFELRLYSNYFKINNSVWFSYGDGENISYATGYESSTYDRSYVEYIYGLSSNKKINFLLFVDRIGSSFIIKNRQYKEESVDDPIHSGREDLEYHFSFWMEQKLTKSMSHQFKVKFREKDVFSDYFINYLGGTGVTQSVATTNLKSFEKFEFIYKIVLDTHLDFLF